MSANEANLCEIFNSIQGEGRYVGARQIFIRFAGCNLSCQYCDSAEALEIPKEMKVYPVAGKKDFKQYKNPVDSITLIESALTCAKPQGVNHSICLTGGEPLLQVDFLKSFIPQLKKEIDLPIYLETNGVLPDHLLEIIDLIDIVAFDIKLPSATLISSYLKEHKKALEIAYMKELFVKMVFTRETKVSEMVEAISLIANLDDKIPLVLQPVTPHGPIKHRPNPEQILAFQTMAARKLKWVRVIPQVHKILGIL
ncbi:MAG: 7-carboxy-7-deazaguanine synthase QueE [Candidatus Saganbacteria bacterium]|nr:7-carboxy-7-deazaguanine synthase QueE [Candidatus Saganbacteria bacterium]